MKWKDHLSSDPKICGGQICIKGTRIMISVILDNIAEGNSIKEILDDYPTLTENDIYAVVKYASLVVKDEIIVI